MDSIMSEAARSSLLTNGEAARESSSETDAGFLWDFWYPAVRSADAGFRCLMDSWMER